MSIYPEGDLVNRKRAKGQVVGRRLRRQHDAVGATWLAVAMAGVKIVANLMRRNTNLKRQHIFQIRESIRVRQIEANLSRPGDARRPAQIPTRPQMYIIPTGGGEVSVPIICKLIQGRNRVSRIVRVGRNRPGVLEHDGERQPNVSLINRLNLIHDAQDVVVRTCGIAAERRHVIKVRFSRDLDHLKRREHLGRYPRRKRRGKLFRFPIDLLLQGVVAGPGYFRTHIGSFV